MLNRLRDARVPVKLWIIVAIAAVGVVATGYARMQSVRPREMSARQDKVQQLTETARTTIAGFEARERSGELTRQEAQKGAIAAVKSMRYGGDGYFWINDMKPFMVAHPMKPKLEGTDLSAIKDPNGKRLFVAFVDEVKAHKAGFVDYMWEKPGASQPVPKLSYVAGFAPWQWVVGTGIYIDDVDAAVRAEMVTVAWQTALILLVISLLAFAVSRSISRPVADMAARMRTLAAGEVDDDASATRGLVETRAAMDDLVAYLHDASHVAGRIAEGDLTVEAQPRSERDVLGQALAKMTASLRSLVGGVADSAGTLSSASQQMAATSEEAGRAVGEIASAVTEVAEGAERQVRMVESTRSAVQQAADAAGASAESAQTTAQAADNARQVARDGVDAAEQASEAIRQVAASSTAVGAAIEELSARSERIGGIVETIAGIAEQTNLLALNAAIEAARAGEQGRGFAVVAEEVRKLAEESEVAAGQIGELVGEMQSETGKVVTVVAEAASRTEDGVATVARARGAFEQIAGAVEAMSVQVAEIATAVQQIGVDAQRAEADVAQVASVAEESSAAAEQVSASTQETSASTQQIAASAQTLANTAEQLDQLVNRFKVTA
jgi:methyl-accepting chemotaxis protein